MIGGQVPNPSNPEFKPSDLFGFWEERKARFAVRTGHAANTVTKPAVLSPAAVELLVQKFEQLDSKRDGMLSFEEIKAGFDGLGSNSSDEEYRQFWSMLRRHDQETRGDRTKISKQDFIKAILYLQHNIDVDHFVEEDTGQARLAHMCSTHMHTCVRAHVCVHACVCARLRACVRACVCACVHMHMPCTQANIHMHADSSEPRNQSCKR